MKLKQLITACVIKIFPASKYLLLVLSRRSSLLFVLCIFFTFPALSFAQGQFISTHMDPWIPNPVFGSTFKSNLGGGSGFWDSPSSWSTNRVPSANDRVIIQAGDEITIRSTSASANSIGIYPGGKLRFANNTNTELKIVTLLVLGELEIGTSAAPISPSVTARIVFRDAAIDLNADPGQYGNGLLALNSAKVRIHGAALAETFIRLASEPKANDSTLTLSQAPTGWKVGDKIAVPDSRHLKWNEVPDGGTTGFQWEERDITAIQGATLTLNAPLTYNHLGARSASGSLDFLPHVLNRSRNVELVSENPAGTRGHTLYGGGSDIDIRYAAFRNLGRTKNTAINNTKWDASGNVTQVGTNQIARYPIHTHHLIGTTQSNGYQFTLLGNSVDNEGAAPEEKWAIGIHGSHYGLIKQNTAYNITGSAIVTEDGSESYNVIEKNFVLRCTSIGSGWRFSADLTAREATGFWFRGPLNYVRNNVAANIMTQDMVETAYGYKYLFYYLGTKTIPAAQGANPMTNGISMNLNTVPILEFSNNEVYGATSGGMTYWWVGMQDNTPLNVSGTSVIKNLHIWNVHERGIFAYHTNRLTLDGLVVRGTDPRSTACCGYGYDANDYPQKDNIFRNIDIQNMSRGIQLSGSTYDITIENALLRNSDFNIKVHTPYSCCGFTGQQPAVATLRNIVFGPHLGSSNTATTIQMVYHKGANLIQKNEVHVYNYNGVQGDNFQVYYTQQAPDFIVPQSTNTMIASPEAGLTNQENWNKYGIAIAGSVARCLDNTTRPEIKGFTCPLLNQDPIAPSAPTNLRAN